MRYSIRTVTPAASIPLVISLDEAKAHLRVEGDDEDLLITAALRAAMDHVERHTGQILTERDLELVRGGFPVSPELIDLVREPVTAIVSLKYTDGDGEEVTVAEADYRWSDSSPDVLMPAFAASWPSAADEAGSVRLRFTAGYEDGLAPPSLIAAVKLMLGHLYANREGVVTGTIATELPMSVQALCAPYRRMAL